MQKKAANILKTLTSTLHIHEEEERKRMEPLTDDERDKVLAQLGVLEHGDRKGKIGRSTNLRAHMHL